MRFIKKCFQQKLYGTQSAQVDFSEMEKFYISYWVFGFHALKSIFSFYLSEFEWWNR